MALNPLFIFFALLACAVLISAADLYKVLDCAYDTVADGNRMPDFGLAEQWTGLHRNRTSKRLTNVSVVNIIPTRIMKKVQRINL